MKTLSWMVLLLVFAPLARAEDTACLNEFKKLNDISREMASLGPDNMEKVNEISARLDQVEPQYRACMDDYGEKNGAEALARLDAQLAGSAAQN